MSNATKFMLGMLAFLLVVSFASAALISYPSTLNLSVQQGDSASSSFILFNNAVNTSVSLSFSGNTSGMGLTLSPSLISNLENGTNSSAITLSVSPSFNQATGVYHLYVDNGSTHVVDVSITVTQSIENIICGNRYNSSVMDIRSVSDEELDNEDSWEWGPLDNIEISARIENNAEDDLEYDVDLFFFDSNSDVSDEIASDEDDLSIEGYDIDEGDSETLTFNFQVDGEVEEGSYELYAKVLDEEGRCYVEHVDNVEISKESKEVLVKDVEADNSVACGDQVQLTAFISNTGSQDEDQVKIILYNKDLGLNLFKEIQNLDEGDSEQVSFNFAIPANAQEKSYKLTFSTEFDYDEDDEDYDEESDSEDDYEFTLSVLGNCVDLTKPTLTAKLTSDAKVGEEMTVEISVKNNGDSQISTLLSAGSYDSWAKLSSINTSLISIAKQETKTSVLTFVPSKAGQQTFELTLLYNGKTITQPVTVSVSENSGIWSSVFNFSSYNLTTYLIVGIVVLVILILVILLIKTLFFKKG